MPGLPRGADHIDRTGGIPEYGSFLPQSSRALEPTLTFSGPSSAGFANDIMSAPYCSRHRRRLSKSPLGTTGQFGFLSIAERGH